MTDRIAAMCTSLRNWALRCIEEPYKAKVSVQVPYTRVCKAIADVLVAEGYLEACSHQQGQRGDTLDLMLKYINGKPVMSAITRKSRPGLRLYVGLADLPRINNGLGLAIISTSEGIMTADAAREAQIGGEWLVTVE